MACKWLRAWCGGCAYFEAAGELVAVGIRHERTAAITTSPGKGDAEEHLPCRSLALRSFGSWRQAGDA
eukprot:3889600-Prorocentrum_lima.AAC.1